jgi:hypothetical protein
MSKYVTFAMQGNSNYPIFRHMLVKLLLDFARYKQFLRTLARYLIKVFENTGSIIFENTRSILIIFENARSLRVLATRRFLVRGQITLDSLSLELAHYTMLTFIRAVLYLTWTLNLVNLKQWNNTLFYYKTLSLKTHQYLIKIFLQLTIR